MYTLTFGFRVDEAGLTAALRQQFPSWTWTVSFNGMDTMVTYHDGDSPEAIAAAVVAYVAQEESGNSLLRTRVLQIAQSAVGTQVDQLTANQVRALVAILLWKAGALTPQGAVKPLGQWN
jgi:hypothetical protein